MRKNLRIALIVAAFGVPALLALPGLVALRAPQPLGPQAFAAHYQRPLAPPEGEQSVFHLGHSLVGQDMPAMLAELAGHAHASQLGLGASLAQHWQAEVPGLDGQNTHAAYREPHAALAGGDHTVLVLTELVELADAIRWHDSARAVAIWARFARASNPAIRIYLYETWHRLDDPAGWLARIDADLEQLWEGQILRPAMADPQVGTIYLIPGGQVMAAAVRAIEAGEIPGLSSRTDLFRQNPDGTADMIHFNDFGAYLMAITHYAVIYQRSPAGLPHRVARADGSPAGALPEEAARALQKLVWRVVTRYPETGVAGPVAD